jgi:CRP-like cAMP-binding protein
MSVAKISTRKVHDVGRSDGVSPLLLRRFSRLAGMPDATLERVARGSECLLIPAGSTIFTQDDGADAVYLLLDGEIRLEHEEMDGDVVKYRVFGPHATFGDTALLGEPRCYYTANTDAASVIIRTPLSLLRDALAANPEIAQAWIHAVSADMERRGHRMAAPAPGIAVPAFPDAA